MHIASDTIAAWAPELGPTLIGDKAHSMLFDTSKVRTLVPEFRTTITFAEGARRVVKHVDRHPELHASDRDDVPFDAMIAHALAAGASG